MNLRWPILGGLPHVMRSTPVSSTAEPPPAPTWPRPPSNDTVIEELLEELPAFPAIAERACNVATNELRVGEGPLVIYRSARKLYRLFLEAFELAGPRMRAIDAAAGPWREHGFNRACWKTADAVIVAEALTSVLSRSSEQTLCGRPDSPYANVVGRSEGRPTDEPRMIVRVVLPELMGASGCLIINLAPHNSETYAAASPGTIYVGHDVIRAGWVQARSRNPQWHAHVMEIMAHECAHIWQFQKWKAPPSTASTGGPVERNSPHAARPWETYANACGHAAWLLEDGTTALDSASFDRIVSEMSLPDSPWRRLWVDWLTPEFQAMYPFEAHATRRYHRFLRTVLPIFRAARDAGEAI